jgi:hypothetical protein
MVPFKAASREKGTDVFWADVFWADACWADAFRVAGR